MKSYCNPLDLCYRFMRSERHANQPCREGSDPALIFWRGRYILAMSKTSGLHWSDDLQNWHFIPSKRLPSEGYGPDFWTRKGELYYVNGAQNGEVFRAIDLDADQWEKVGEIGYLPDPKIFVDSDDRTYLYWGSAVEAPLQAVELDSDTFERIGEVISCNAPEPQNHGWERSGENNCPDQDVLRRLGISHPDIPDYYPECYNEGAYLTSYQGRYYLQNAIPATEFNIYCDAISTGNTPLGPFTFQADNPFSLKPGGFINGAGHSCNFEDRWGNFFQVSTMRISRRHIYERRIGLFPAGFYEDGTMYCQTRFGDWPHYIPEEKYSGQQELFTQWMLLSYQAKITAVSCEAGHEPEYAVDEDIRTCYRSATDEFPCEMAIDLEQNAELCALQINFAEERCLRNYDEHPMGCAKFTVETSIDGTTWKMAWDQRDNQDDRTHCYHQMGESVQARWVRLRIFAMANGGRAALSGFRIFGHTDEPIPMVPEKICIVRQQNDLTIAELSWKMPKDAIGVNILWGTDPTRLHHAWQTLGRESWQLPSLSAKQQYYVALEAFGRGGVAKLSPVVKI